MKEQLKNSHPATTQRKSIFTDVTAPPILIKKDSVMFQFSKSNC